MTSGNQYTNVLTDGISVVIPSETPVTLTTPLIPTPLPVTQDSFPWQVSGSLNLSPTPLVLNVSGSIINVSPSGIQHSLIDNFPTTTSVEVQNFPPIQQVALTEAITVTVSGLDNVTVTNLVSVSGTVGGTVNIANLPNLAASGIQHTLVDNFPSVQTVEIANIPAVQPVSFAEPITVAVSGIDSVIVSNLVSISGTVGGTVAIGNLPSTYPGAATIASGTSNINLGNFPTIQTVTGTVNAISASGTQNAHIDNFPTVQTVEVANLPSSYPGAITIASGTSNLNIGNFPNTQTVEIANNSIVTTATSGTNYEHIDNFPTVQTVQFNPSQSVGISNFPASQPITVTSGTSNINVGNFPTVQEVYVINEGSSSTLGAVTAASGTLNSHIDNFPTIQTVEVANFPTIAESVTIASGTSNINIGNFPTVTTVQQSSNTPWLVSGTLNVSPSFFTVSGTVTNITGSGIQHALIDNFPTVTTVQVANPVLSNQLLIHSGTSWQQAGTAPGDVFVPVALEGIEISSQGADNTNNVGSRIGVSSHLKTYDPTTNTWDRLRGTPGGVAYVSISGSSLPPTVSGMAPVHVDNFPTVQTVQPLIAQDASGNTKIISANNTGSTTPSGAFYLGVTAGGNLTGLTSMSNAGDGLAGTGSLATGAYIYNGTTFDRARSAPAAAITQGTGLLGAGMLIYDGVSYRNASGDTKGNQNVNVVGGQVVLASGITVTNFPATQSVSGTVTVSGTIIAGGAFPTSTVLKTYENIINTNTTTVVTASTCYLSTLVLTVATGQTGGAITVEDGQGSPQILVNGLATTAATLTPTTMDFSTPIKMTNGIQIITSSSTTAATIGIWINYYQ